MAYVRAGIKEVLLGTGSADFATDGMTGIVGLGYVSTASKFTVDQFNEIKDYRGRTFPNMLNFKTEVSTMQPSNELFKFLFTDAIINNDVSVAVLTSGLTKTDTDTISSSTGGIYIMKNADSTGIDFEFSITPKERILKLTLEQAYKYATGTTLLNNASSNTIGYAAGKIPNFNPDAVIKGFIVPSYMSSLNGTFTDDRIEDFKMTIKGKGQKNGFNKTLIESIDVSLDVTISGASATELYNNVSGLGILGSDVTLSIPTGETTPSSIVLKSGGLSKSTMFDLGDKRNMKVTFSGGYDIDFINWNDTTKVLTLNNTF